MQAEGRGCDPAVAVVDLVTEGMPNLLAGESKLSTSGDHLAVWLENHQLSDPSLEAS